MASFVLDASIAISWCFPGDPTENTQYSRSILARLTVDDALVPEIWPFEIANSIFVSHTRRRRIGEQQVREYLTLLRALPIRVIQRGLHENIGLESWRAVLTSQLMTRHTSIWQYASSSPLLRGILPCAMQRVPKG